MFGVRNPHSYISWLTLIATNKIRRKIQSLVQCLHSKCFSVSEFSSLAVRSVDQLTYWVFVQVSSFFTKGASLLFLIIGPTFFMNFWNWNALIESSKSIDLRMSESCLTLWASVKPSWVFTICNCSTSSNQKLQRLLFSIDCMILSSWSISGLASVTTNSSFFVIKRSSTWRMTCIMTLCLIQ